jgi:hypothetical protein
MIQKTIMSKTRLRRWKYDHGSLSLADNRIHPILTILAATLPWEGLRRCYGLERYQLLLGRDEALECHCVRISGGGWVVTSSDFIVQRSLGVGRDVIEIRDLGDDILEDYSAVLPPFGDKLEVILYDVGFVAGASSPLILRDALWVTLWVVARVIFWLSEIRWTSRFNVPRRGTGLLELP